LSFKKLFWAPDSQEEGIPQILDVHFQIALTFEHVTAFSSVQISELR